MRGLADLHQRSGEAATGMGWARFNGGASRGPQAVDFYAASNCDLNTWLIATLVVPQTSTRPWRASLSDIPGADNCDEVPRTTSSRPGSEHLQIPEIGETLWRPWKKVVDLSTELELGTSGWLSSWCLRDLSGGRMLPRRTLRRSIGCASLSRGGDFMFCRPLYSPKG